MIVKGRELVRFVSTLSQFLLLFLPSLLPLPSSPPIFFFLLIFYIYVYICISSFSYSYFSSCFMYRSFIGVGPRARAICASDDLFAVIKETKADQRFRSPGHPFERRVFSLSLSWWWGISWNFMDAPGACPRGGIGNNTQLWLMYSVNLIESRHRGHWFPRQTRERERERERERLLTFFVERSLYASRRSSVWLENVVYLPWNNAGASCVGLVEFQIRSNV